MTLIIESWGAAESVKSLGDEKSAGTAPDLH